MPYSQKYLIMEVLTLIMIPIAQSGFNLGRSQFNNPKHLSRSLLQWDSTHDQPFIPFSLRPGAVFKPFHLNAIDGFLKKKHIQNNMPLYILK